jgi:protein-tyrosine phosphatase
MTDRILSWDGCRNTRDLGGLRTCDGRVTRLGGIIRSDTPSRLTPAGWAALYEYGVRTIITLRTHGLQEDELDFTCPYPDIAIVQSPIEDITDAEFVQQWVDSGLWGTPLYYGDALRRWPDRHAAVISAIARAQPGGVLFHCIRGYDRTGIISLLVLALAGVAPEEIAADYALSVDTDRDAFLARKNLTIQEALLSSISGLDLDAYLLSGGASPEDLTCVRNRLAGEERRGDTVTRRKRKT